MLSESTISNIATMLKISPSDLKEKISSEKEEELSLQELKVFTPEEFETRVKNEKSTSYQEGKTAQEEMLVKQAKKDMGYDFEGKSFESFLEHHNANLKGKYSKGDDSRIKELEADIAKLNENHANALSQLQEKNQSLSGQVLRAKISNQLLSTMPAETTIEKSDIMLLFNANHEIEEQEGKLIVKRNGETIKDETTASPLDVKEVFKSFISEKNYVKGNPGRGTGSESGGSGYTGNSISEFNDSWEKSGKKLYNAEYDKAYAEFRSKNPNPVM